MVFGSNKPVISFLFATVSTFVFFQNCSPFETLRINDLASQSHHENQEYSLLDSTSDAIALDVSKNIDTLAANCTLPLLAGYKCLDQKIKTSEGKTYGIRIKWNRAGVESRGSFVSVGGGTGKGEALEDEAFRTLVSKLDREDQVRAIFLEFTDDPKVAKDWGGCWSQGGGYRSAGLLFRDAIKLIVEDLRIPRGQFLNYLGLSNGTMLVSYGMSNFNMDRYFDRVVMHAGPVMASAVEACDVNNPKSILAANTKERADNLLGLFSLWLNGDGGANMCTNIRVDDRMSVLGTNRNFTNTHIHTVIGALENKPYGFGNYHIVSNEDWFNKINAKSKQRLTPELMGHLYSYQDIRRFLKLDRNQSAAPDTDCPDTFSEVCESGTVFRHVKRSCVHPFTDIILGGAGWNKVADKHYKISAGRTCSTTTPPQTGGTCGNSGQFTNESNGDIIAFQCDCPAGKDMTGWTKVEGTCYHKLVQAGKVFKASGDFFGDGKIITGRNQRFEGGGANLKVCIGLSSASATSCIAASDFVFMRDRVGAQGRYDAAADVYYVRDDDLRASQFPFAMYSAVFILSDGTRRRVDMIPTYK